MAISEMFPYLRVRNAADAIAFYVEVFGAREQLKLTDPNDGRIGHAELALGEGMIVMLSDEYPEMGLWGPDPDRGPSMSVHLHVDDCDALLAKAVAAGATVKRPATDQFYGERSATFVDPFGCEWNVGHRHRGGRRGRNAAPLERDGALITRRTRTPATPPTPRSPTPRRGAPRAGRCGS